MVGENRVVFPEYLAAAKAVRNGEIGAVEGFLFYTKFPWERNSQGNWRLGVNDPGAGMVNPGAGILLDHAPHYDHFLTDVLGFVPKTAVHLGSTFGQTGVDVAVGYELRDDHGKVAVIWIDGTAQEREGLECIRMYGSKGEITIRYERGKGDAHIEPEGEPQRELPWEHALQ